MNTFNDLRIGSRFEWQGGSAVLVKTGRDSAKYANGDQPLLACDKPNPYRTVKAKRLRKVR